MEKGPQSNQSYERENPSKPYLLRAFQPYSECTKIGSPKCRERKCEERNGAESFSEIILPNAVKHRKFPQTVSQNASFCKTVSKCFFLFICVFCFRQKLPQSTVSQAFPSNKSYESKAGCNRTPATVLWVPLISAP